MEREFKNKHGTVVIRGQTTFVKEATKKMFKEVERDGKKEQKIES